MNNNIGNHTFKEKQKFEIRVQELKDKLMQILILNITLLVYLCSFLRLKFSLSGYYPTYANIITEKSN